MTPAEILDLLGSEARDRLRTIVAQMLNGDQETTVESTPLDRAFMGAGPELNALTHYDLLAAAAEVVSEGGLTIRRADTILFQNEVLGSARFVAVVVAEGAPDRVRIGDDYLALYYSGNKLHFRREH